MKISQVAIHNYRGIHDGNFSLKDYSLLVGPNNAGKSTVINALRAFYEKDGFKFKKEIDLPFINPIDKESWIEISYKLTDDEYNLLAKEYRGHNNKLTVKKYLETDKKTADEKSAINLTFGKKVDGSYSDDPFYGIKSIQSGKLGEIIYIPAVSKVDEHTKLTGPSALRDLLQTLLSNNLTESETYTTFDKAVSCFSDGICQEKTKGGHSIKGFESDLNQLLQSWSVKFSLKLVTPSTNDIVKLMLDYDFQDTTHKKFQEIENFGSGFQRHFIFSLINLASRYTMEEGKKKEKGFSPSMKLLLFEEPEAFLHPPQQDILARSLMTVSQSEDMQVICSTHSPHFVNRNSQNIPGLIHFKREKGIISIFQISEQDWKEIVDSNLMINKIAVKYKKMAKKLTEEDNKVEMESVKHFLWLNPDRCGLFFANHVLLVEGPTEVGLINKLIGEGKIKKSESGLYVLDCLGKYNIHRFINMIAFLGINHSVIFDDDNNKDEHQEINQLIEDSRKAPFTFKIKKIPGELESYLNVKCPGSDHRKPQHMLYLYENGDISKEKIDNFCNLIDSCIP